METQDGFIVGIYNYCDRWCERCSLSSRCRVFAEERRMSSEPPSAPCPDTSAEPMQCANSVSALRSLGAVVAAFEEDLPDVPVGQPRHAPRSGITWPDVPPAEAALHQRVSHLGHRLRGWLAPEHRAKVPAVTDAVEVLQHFGIYIGPKVYRALKGREGEDWNLADGDANGSAKAALLALDRIGDAWLRLAEHGAISVLEAAPVLTELQQLTAELERLFPRARSFVRPGFDEPEAVAMLDWREQG